MDKLTVKELQALIEQKEQEKKKRNFSKKVVTAVILLNIIFTAAVFYTFLRTGSEPMTLIGAWFGFTTVELWSLSKIKRDEIKEHEAGEWNNDH